jgi:serine/threonine protein kinase
LKELEILEKTKSKFIVKYYESYFLETSFWIVMEFCDGGSVKNILQKLKNTKENLNEETI